MKPLTIIRLDIEGFKKIRAVSITPNGGPVEIRGDNAQGKSSVLDAIEAALVGRGAIPDDPVHHGAPRATVRIDTGKFAVEKVIRPDGKSTLKITSPDPNQPCTQAWLDEQIGQLSFDPYEFVRMKPKEQAAKLREATGIDTTAVDAERARLFEERTFVNREHKRLEGAWSSAEYPDGPDEPVAVGGLLRQLEAANEQKRAIAESRAEVAAARRELATLDERVAELKRALADAQKTRTASAERLAAMELEDAAQEEPDTAALERQIREAQSVNEAVRMRDARRLLSDEVQAKAKESQALTDQIEEIDRIKKSMLETAKFPIPNLRIDEEGVWLNGAPLGQASQAERLRFAVALGLALNPNVRVILIRDGSLLGPGEMEMVAKMAADAGAQLWIEIVSLEAGSGWLIEDGELVAQPQ